jgi:hypothetical protein
MPGPDGTPQLSCVWVAVHGDEILSGHMQRRQKVRNVKRHQRRAVGRAETGLREYLVLHGRARVQEGGAAVLLQELAHVYLGPDGVFPPPGLDVPGYVLRITPERLGGVGPWTSDASRQHHWRPSPVRRPARPGPGRQRRKPCRGGCGHPLVSLPDRLTCRAAFKGRVAPIPAPVRAPGPLRATAE